MNLFHLYENLNRRKVTKLFDKKKLMPLFTLFIAIVLGFVIVPSLLNPHSQNNLGSEISLNSSQSHRSTIGLIDRLFGIKPKNVYNLDDQNTKNSSFKDTIEGINSTDAQSPGIMSSEKAGKDQSSTLKNSSAHPEETLISRSKSTSRDAFRQNEAYEDSSDAPPPEPLWISGLILNDLGKPVSGIEVTAQLQRLFRTSDNNAPTTSQTEWITRSDSTGTYMFQEVADGEYIIHTPPTDQYNEEKITTRAGVDTADIVLTSLQKIWVHGFVDDLQGSPLYNVRVFNKDAPQEKTFTDTQGKYRLQISKTNTKPRYTIQFNLEEYLPNEQSLTNEEAGESNQVQLDAMLEPVATLTQVSGRLTDINGKPIPNESVNFYSIKLSQNYKTTTGSSGEFTFYDVVTGEDYQLEIRPKGPYKDYIRTNLSVSPEGLDLSVSLDSLHESSISGVFRDSYGNPIPYFTLSLRSNEALNNSWMITSNASGQYSIDQITDGELIFETNSFPHFIVSGIKITSNTAENLDLILDWGNYEIHGLLQDKNGSPISRSEIILSWSLTNNTVVSRSTRRSTSDSNGNFLFTQLGPGPHTLYAIAPGYQATQLETNAAETGEEVELRLLQ